MQAPETLGGIGARERRWLVIFLGLGSAVFAFLLAERVLEMLSGFSQIILILFLAWLLAFVMSPIARAFRQVLPVSHALAAVLAYLLALIVLGFILFYAGSAISQQLAALTADLPETQRTIEATLAAWQTSLGLDRFQIDLVGLFDTAGSQVGNLIGAIFEQAEAIAGATVATLGALSLILILSLYLLMDSDRIMDKLSRAVPRRYQDELRILQVSVSRAFGGFLRAQLVLAVIMAALVALLGPLFGVPYLFLWGLLSALAMLIPVFGPPLALIPPILATWVYQPDAFLFATIFLVVAQGVVVSWLQPRLMQGALGMHPILVLVALLVGAQAAGVWGALFGIPVVAVLNVFLNLFVWSEVPNAALPMAERLSHVGEGTMVRVAREQVSDETHPHIHVHRSLRPDGSEEVELVVDPPGTRPPEPPVG